MFVVTEQARLQATSSAEQPDAGETDEGRPELALFLSVLA
jgi:hypothetical protein